MGLVGRVENLFCVSLKRNKGRCGQRRVGKRGFRAGLKAIGMK
jgi:hypothetical protein